MTPLGAFAGLSPMPARERVIAVARVLHGVPYLWAGNTLLNGGVDCSGYVQLVYAEAGIEPWATDYPAHMDLRASELSALMLPVGEDAHPLPGDIAIYGKDEQHVTHVMLVVRAEPDGSVSELFGASRGDRTLVSVDAALEKGARVKTFAGANYRGDLLGFRRMPGGT